MIAGYHIIFGAYGFWLPNDPRGSWSDFVGSWELFRYGPATKTIETRSCAHRNHDNVLRIEAKRALRYPPVQFNGMHAKLIGESFGGYFQRNRVAVWACAILPDHVHLVIGPLPTPVERLVVQLKGSATRHLIRQGMHPFQEVSTTGGRVPRCFARGQWKVYLAEEEIPRVIRYVEENPLKEGKKRQHWSFVNSDINF